MKFPVNLHQKRFWAGWLLLGILFLRDVPASVAAKPEFTANFSLVCPFYTTFDRVTPAEFEALWQDGEPISGKIDALMTTAEVLRLLEAKLGTANPASVQTRTLGTIQAILAEKSGTTCGILPTVDLQPNWKRIAIGEELPPWDAGYDPAADPLAVADDSARWAFDPDKATTLLLTGTTALTRTTSYKMATKGIDYPAEKIVDLFRNTDLTHVSNESAFWSLCPEPVLNAAPMQFCTPASYLSLFKTLGVDIVELTGNHLRDYDWPPLMETFGLLEAGGFAYYGAGRTVEAARKPLYLAHHGNQFVFLGCNIAGPEHVYISDQLPGVNRCDIPALAEEVKSLIAEGKLVIVTLQYYETYSRVPTDMQLRDFELLSDAGAVVVSGSQAHYPQIMAAKADRFVHYGLGNLFFDQMDRPVPGTRQEFLDRYVFYDGRLIQVELVTTLLEDYAQPRFMTEPERQAFLEEMFSYVK